MDELTKVDVAAKPLPCPWCGELPTLRVGFFYDDSSLASSAELTCDRERICPAAPSVLLVEIKPVSEAIAACVGAWNDRKQPAPAPEEGLTPEALAANPINSSI